MLQCSNAPYKMYKLLVILNSIIAPMLQCSNAPLEHEKMYKPLRNVVEMKSVVILLFIIET